MRIWVLTNEYAGNIIGGLGVVATHLSRALSRREGLHVTVICKGQERRVTAVHGPSLSVIRFPRNSRFHSVASQFFRPVPVLDWLKRHGIAFPDLIHVHSLQCLELAEYMKTHERTPIVYTCHSTVKLEPSQVGRAKTALRQEKLIRLADAVTAPSEWQKSVILGHYPHAGDVRVIRNGVVERRANRRQSKNRYRLLFVGRMNRIKGVDELLRAVALLRKTHPRVGLDLVGSGSKSYTLRLKRLSRQMRLTGKVRWLGKRNPAAVWQLYPRYGAVVVPSRHESFGLVALEAMASGVPLVATRNGGLQTFVNDGNAEIIAGVTPRDIASAVRRVWRNPEQTSTKVRRAQETAKSYRWDDIARHYHFLFAQYAKG